MHVPAWPLPSVNGYDARMANGEAPGVPSLIVFSVHLNLVTIMLQVSVCTLCYLKLINKCARRPGGLVVPSIAAKKSRWLKHSNLTRGWNFRVFLLTN